MACVKVVSTIYCLHTSNFCTLNHFSTDLHTKQGTSASVDGTPITWIKFPHIGGHEGVGRIVAIGPGAAQNDPLIKIGKLVGVRFSSRVCRRCGFCLAGKEQYCSGPGATNHLHHEAGSFQEYIALDAGYLTLLPDESDPVTIGPVLCAGLTAYKAVLNTEVKVGEWLVVVGAGGGLGQFAVQYALVRGARVLGVDSGAQKRDYIKGLGAEFLDFKESTDLVADVKRITDGGAQAAVVTAGSPQAYKLAADLLRTEGTLCACGIPPGGGRLDTAVSGIVIKGLKIKGNLVGNLKECLEAVDQVNAGIVKPRVYVRPFRDLPKIYEEMERGDILGRMVVKIGDDPFGPPSSRL